MTYTKTVWVNGSAPAINATNLNKIEDGIFDNNAEITIVSGTVSTLVSSLATVSSSVSTLTSDFDEHLESVMPHEKFAFKEEITYTSEKITQVDTLIADVLRKREIITYDLEVIDRINIELYDVDGVTLLEEFEDTVSYDDGKIDEIVRVVV